MTALKDTKQVIVIRKDINMSFGKAVSQACHASMAFLTGSIKLSKKQDKVAKEWLANSYAKICLCVDTEEQLKELQENAKKLGLISALITDSGRTEFNGIPTVTCLSIGPGYVEDIDKITGHLRLVRGSIR